MRLNMTGIIFDIDDVITDGSVIVKYHGRESKRINMKNTDMQFMNYIEKNIILEQSQRKK